MKTIYYPTKCWKKESPEKHNINVEIVNTLNNMIEEDFSHLTSVLIVKNGSIIYEKYLNGCSQNTLHETGCVFKSFLSAVVGTALQDNLIKNVETKVVDFFLDDIPENIDKNFNKITLKHLLTKTSGIKWPPKNYRFPENKRFNDIRLPFLLTVKNEPGNIFEYKPDPHILFYVIEKLSGIDFVSYADKKLFSPLGIKDYLWNTNFHEDECLLMKTRDIAKLGYLYLNNGLWVNHQLISSEYIQESTREHVYGNFPESSPYGYLWWVNDIEKHKTFYAGGFGGQYLYVIPDLQLIFVSTSNVDKPHQENKLLVKEFMKMIKANGDKPNIRNRDRKNLVELTKEEKNKLINEIQTFFLQERNEEIGIIAAGTVLEFFLENLGAFIYNKSLDEAKIWFCRRIEDMEIDYDTLYK
ncbi:DUF2164 family protein [Clostridium sp. BJN0013]|mgnify:CR=1 FL=1|uniref:DUF2164 family protein n=1 Tax=Clostridium sp. BJN0013 TaxID=3236840 RepID=UPI0034C5CF5E